MDHELIDLNIDRFTEKVLEVAKIAPSRRKKPLLAIVRGQGGGKSRCLEELRMKFNSMEEVLPITITFNQDTQFDLELENWDTKGRKMFCALSLIARLASTYYEENFEIIVERMKALYDKDLMELFKGRAALFLRLFLKYLVSDSSQPIKTLVVMVDEVMKFEESIPKRFIDSEEDANYVLREAVLSASISPDLEAALVMSALTTTRLGKTTSGRIIEALELPEKLNEKDLVQKWLVKDSYTSLSVQVRHQLELFSSTINSNPRMCEYAQGELRSLKGPGITQQMLSTLFLNIINSTKQHYTIKLPRKLLYPLLYGKSVPLDEKVLAAIQSSSISNSVSEIKDEVDIIPVTSFIAVYLALKNDGSLPAELSKQMEEMLQSILSFKQGGDVLEVLFEKVFILRLMVARLLSKQPLTFAELFGVTSIVYTSKIDNKRTDFLNRALFPFMKSQQSKTINLSLYEMKYSSRKNEELFREELLSIEVDKNFPVTVIKPVAQDAFDLGIMSYQGRKQNPIILLLEFKSSLVKATTTATTTNSSDPDYITKLPHSENKEEGHQYLHILKVLCSNAVIQFPIDVSSLVIGGTSPLAGHKYEDVVQYVYVTSYKGETISKWGALKLVESDLERFFCSPFWNVYQVCRGIMKN